MQIALERYKNGQANEILNLLDEANSEIAKYIKKTSSVTTKARYKEIAKKLKEISARLRKEVDENTDVDGLIEYELKKEKKLLELINPKDKIQFVYPSLEQIKTSALFKPIDTKYGMTYQSYLDGIEEGLYNTWDTAVRTGYLTGQSTQKIVRNVLGKAGKVGELAEPGTMQRLRNSVYANTRTALQSFANETMQRVYAENEQYFGDGVSDYKYEYLATLDSRTCIVCGECDGKLYKSLDECPVIPQHRGCRCVILPYFNIKGDTRASRTGQIDADTTFENWLKEQDDETQLDVLGRTRYELFKKGERLTSFVDNGKTLTLKELSKQDVAIANAINAIRHKEKGWVINYGEKSYDEKLQAVQDWLIRKEAKAKVERGVLLSEKGDILSVTKGTADTVNFGDKRTSDIIKAGKERSLDIIHNHPKNSTLSMRDLRLLYNHPSLRSISVVTKTGHKYTMTAPKRDKTTAEIFEKAFLKSYNKEPNKMLFDLAKLLGWEYNEQIRS